MQVPTATSLENIYPADAVDAQTKRWEHLLANFKTEYGEQAHFVSRSPGRVNLIGEVSTGFYHYIFEMRY
jgi:galactokinase